MQAASWFITKLPGKPAPGTLINTVNGQFEWDDELESWTLAREEPPLKKEQNERATWSPSPSAAVRDEVAYIEGEFAMPGAKGEYQYPDGRDAYPTIHIDDIVAQNVHFRWPHGDWPTETSRAIMERYLGEWFYLFMSKQADYGDRGNDLGLAGQYAEMSRKFIKLRRAMWEGKELTSEGLEEVIMDLIGHCFLSVHFIRNPELTVHKKGDNK